MRFYEHLEFLSIWQQLFKNNAGEGKNSRCIKVVNDQIGGPTPAKDLTKACIKVVNELTKNPNKKGIYHFSSEPM